MRALQAEQNLESLRAKALLVARACEVWAREVMQLREENARLRGEEPAQEALTLEGLLAEMERMPAASAPEGREAEPPRRPAPQDQRGHGPRPQEQLALEEVVHELSAEASGCPNCGAELQEMAGQFEEAEEITIRPSRVVRLRHRRRKYRCGQCQTGVVTAPGQRKLIPGGRYSVEFAVEVAASKYLDHLPLERQCRIFERLGLEVDSQTLWDQTHAAARHLQPTYERLCGLALDAPVVHADETRWPLLAKEGTSSWYAWTATTPEIASYRVLESRGNSSGVKLLGDYSGVVVADGYQVYESLRGDPARGSPPYKLAHCWAHVLRKFRELEERYPDVCREALHRIGQLYEVERLVEGRFPGGEEDQAERLRLRQDVTRPLLESLRTWLFEVAALPRSDLGLAVRYVLGRWEGLTLFLDDPLIPLDNNAAERALRGPVVGRKNHYGSKSRRGTEVAAIFYTLFETAKLQGVEPKAYVLEALNRAIDSPGAVTLPGALAAQVS